MENNNIHLLKLRNRYLILNIFPFDEVQSTDRSEVTDTITHCKSRINKTISTLLEREGDSHGY